jgi:hypothetical protein
MDVLYNKTEATDQEEEEDEDMGEGDHEMEEEEEEGELMVSESFVLEDYPRDAVLPDLSFSYKDVICKAREVVKFFRHVRKHSFRSKSPTVFNHFCSACRGKKISVTMFPLHNKELTPEDGIPTGKVQQASAGGGEEILRSKPLPGCEDPMEFDDINDREPSEGEVTYFLE